MCHQSLEHITVTMLWKTNDTEIKKNTGPQPSEYSMAKLKGNSEYMWTTKNSAWTFLHIIIMNNQE